ncbi:hypothetical protein [Rhodococcus qingshengii]|uniref:hypothetical protein n=1 Tax=Rhodococcus qingshengii TaxID=334542 RepID=UPI0013155589|nr:hypothetical protein [Rhodococcus qingshengii]
MTLNTRQPTGAVPYPLVLLEGEEFAGKSWMLAELSASDKVGRTFWLDLAEGAGDEYGSIDGARYELIEHDGRWSTILGQVAAARDEAQRAADAGEKPVVLGIDTVTAEWDIHKAYVDMRARRRDLKSGKLVDNPDAEVVIGSDLWTIANDRHRELMQILKTFPGIAVMTAQGTEVAVNDANGNPTGEKKWRVDAQKKVGFDATVWVRMKRSEPPTIIGARSRHIHVRPGSDDPIIIPDLTLEALVFDILKCEPAKAHVRDLPSQYDIADMAAIASVATTRELVNEAWELAQDIEVLDCVTDSGETIRTILQTQASVITAAEIEAAKVGA